MDIHDVSQVPEYFQYLQQQRRTLQNAQSRKGQRPKGMKSRDVIIGQFMFHRMRSQTMPNEFIGIRSSFVPPAYPPCVTPLNDLSKIVIKDLILETHHRGSYMLLRSVTPTYTMTAVMTIVEDEGGNVLTFQLYNRDKELSADGYLTEGTVMIVKEPYLKVMGDGNFGLRVDHLSGVSFIPDHDPLIPLSWRRQYPASGTSADDWKLRGNAYFNKGGYKFAIDCYSKALDCSPTTDETRTIKLNRALTYLRTHRFEAALGDLKTVVSPGDKPSEKALFREAQALYHLHRFRESCNVHKVLSQEYPENTLAKSEFKRAIARLAEQEEGKYQFSQMQREAKKRHPPHLDHATYIGPVCVKPTESRGRGLFTTKAVKAGDLLFCEKAFTHAFQDPDNKKGLSLLINAQTNSAKMGTQAELIELTVQKLSKNPSLLPTIADLYHGSYKPVDTLEVDSIPVVDTFLVERIIGSNCFGSPLLSHEYHARAMKGDRQFKSDSENFHSTGIWPLASYINHSCYRNAERSFVGDMMIVRASQDLAPNTEILFWYKSPLSEGIDKKQVDLANWGFKCSCAICQDVEETTNGQFANRKRLRAILLKEHQSHKSPKIAKFEATLSKLVETYQKPASEVPRLAIWEPYLALAMICMPNDPQKTCQYALKALESLGYIIEGGNIPHVPGTPLLVKQWGLMLDTNVRCWMTLAAACCVVAPDIVAQAEEYARITYRICVGEDETFEETYLKN
ncbi:hypothetical protein FQN53_002151 [Emmonsiellopsis sp. PD_33]|nr:hypothetical protein FQN53_002151 [Emmonsiellopsis sp. PD_33]